MLTADQFRELEEQILACSDDKPFQAIELIVENWQGIAGLVNRLAEENAELKYREVDYVDPVRQKYGKGCVEAFVPQLSSGKAHNKASNRSGDE